jgi:hypothetical protein
LNKNDVLTELEKSRQQLVDILEELNEEEMHTPGVCGKWSVKDILVHLMLWESELVKALWQAQQGGTPIPTLQDGKTDHELNEKWYQEYKDRPLERILPDFHAVRKQTLRRVNAFKDGDFNDPKRYAWLKGTSLWKRISYDSFEHELEHLKEIESWLEAQDER